MAMAVQITSTENKAMTFWPAVAATIRSMGVLAGLFNALD
jgi:hypothetical protein